MKNFSSQGAKELTIEDFKDEEGAIRIIEEFPLDVFVRISGSTYSDLKHHIKTFNIQGNNIPYLGKDGLIFVKSKSMREIDQRDVIQLKELQS